MNEGTTLKREARSRGWEGNKGWGVKETKYTVFGKVTL